ncbi:MAG: hypothetical protein F6K55_04915 [Moorea sp. SIO4A3]|nr:hypothetical protein [Moorena sp. SIO4A3]
MGRWGVRYLRNAVVVNSSCFRIFLNQKHNLPHVYDSPIFVYRYYCIASRE